MLLLSSLLCSILHRSKHNRNPRRPQRKLLPIPGKVAGGSPGPAPVVAPLQFPGILNPNIYIQNQQQAPLFPQLKSPPLNLNLDINGLDDYYDPKAGVIHHIHHIHPKRDEMEELANL